MGIIWAGSFWILSCRPVEHGRMRRGLQKSRPDAGFPVTFENELLAGEPPFSFQAPPDASQ